MKRNILDDVRIWQSTYCTSEFHRCVGWPANGNSQRW